MSPGDVFGYAWRSLGGHRLRAGLSLGGVAIGVASVILLTSLGEGARRYITKEFSSLGTNLVVVIPGKTETTGAMPVFGGVAHDLTLEDCAALERQLPRIRHLAPLTLGTARAKNGDLGRDVTAFGTTGAMLKVRDLKLQTGRYLPEGEIERGQRVVVIGARIARELYPGQNPLGQFLRLGDERYRVIGVIAPRGMSIGMDLDEVVHIPVASAMRLFNRRGLFRILLDVAAHDDIPAVRDGVLRVLKERHDNEEDVTVLTQDAVLASFGRILAILTAALSGIAAISLSVAGIGIMNVMLVSVTERTGEIGLLKAVGTTPRQILGVFLAEASLLSSAGGLIGLGTGFALARLVQVLYPAFPAAPPGWAVAGALFVSLAVGLAFGALPARRASRLDPIAALGRR